MIAAAVTPLPCLIVHALYLVPLILMDDALLPAAAEWLIVLAVLGCIACFILAAASLLGKGGLHLLMAAVFTLIVSALLVHLFQGSDEYSWTLIRQLYSLHGAIGA